MAEAPPTRADDIDVWLDFTIAEGWFQATDLDNLVVPAAMATGAAVFGDLRNGTHIRALHSAKRAADTDADPSTRVRVVRSV